jgi:hypothetical protein
MADDAHLHEAHEATLPLTPDAFIADRQRFWMSFTRLVVTCAGAVAVLLILMALFLV